MAWWANLNKRERILILFTVIIILPVAFYFYLYQPLTDEIDRNEQKLNRIMTDFRAEKEVADSKSKFEREYIELNQRLTNNNKLVTKDVLSDLIVDLNDLAADNKLELLALQPREKEQIKSYFKYPVNLQVTGSYLNMLHYIEDIYELKYLLRIERIIFSSKSEAESTDSQLNMGIKLAGYSIESKSSKEGD